jgi:hypothetical protein
MLGMTDLELMLRKLVLVMTMVALVVPLGALAVRDGGREREKERQEKQAEQRKKVEEQAKERLEKQVEFQKKLEEVGDDKKVTIVERYTKRLGETGESERVGEVDDGGGGSRRERITEGRESDWRRTEDIEG